MHHKGDCAGTCPACEQEREYLERQLYARQKMGAPIKTIGLSMALAFTQPDDDVIMGAVVMTPPPSFPGGRDSLIAFLKENLHYPQSAIDDRIEGTVRVRFVVRPDGTISNANVTQSVDPRLDEEALRVVRSMPNWKPSSKGVNTPYILPIRFSLEGNNPTTAPEEVKESE